MLAVVRGDWESTLNAGNNGETRELLAAKRLCMLGRAAQNAYLSVCGNLNKHGKVEESVYALCSQSMSCQKRGFFLTFLTTVVRAGYIEQLLDLCMLHVASR